MNRIVQPPVIFTQNGPSTIQNVELAEDEDVIWFYELRPGAQEVVTGYEIVKRSQLGTRFPHFKMEFSPEIEAFISDETSRKEFWTSA